MRENNTLSFKKDASAKIHIFNPLLTGAKQLLRQPATSRIVEQGQRCYFAVSLCPVNCHVEYFKRSVCLVYAIH